MEPHMSSPSPCNYNAKLIKHETQPLTKQGSFTSVQMVHTHTDTHTHTYDILCTKDTKIHIRARHDAKKTHIS